MNLLLELFFPFSLVVPGLWLLQIAKIKTSNKIERLSLSYLLSLTVLFTLLYLGGIINAFNTLSLIAFGVMIISSIHLLLLLIRKGCLPYSLRSNLSCISTVKLFIVVSIAGLISIYVLFLHLKAILDSDVVNYYLPIAREIVKKNGLTHNTGYDYNIFLKPIGLSVLYAWIYVISNSLSSEAFRLIPLIPLIILILLNHKISYLATKSQTISMVATAIFLVLPFHDRFLLFNSFYPDILYYPLVFIVIYFTIKYSQTKENSSLFWIGLSLGVASLLKAQTIYLLLTTLLILSSVEFKSQKLSLILCLMLPFSILLPNILLMSITPKGFSLYFPTMDSSQLISMAFLLVPSLICFLVVKKIRKIHNIINETENVLLIIKKALVLFLPLMFLASLWWLFNVISTGTLIDIQPLNLPNWTKAKGILKSISQQLRLPNICSFLLYFASMPLDPALMGYAWLLPLLVGLIYSLLKKRDRNFYVLLAFGITFWILLTSHNVYASFTPYNPRDIFPIIPLLTTLSSIGLTFQKFNTKEDGKLPIMEFILVSWLGFMSYVNSVLLWWYPNSSISILMEGFASIFNLDLKQTSSQISCMDRIPFLWENITNLVALSIISCFPFLLLIMYRFFRWQLRKRPYNFHLKIKMKLKLTVSRKFTSLVKTTLVILIMLLIIVAPRMDIFSTGGGISNYGANQLKKSYGDFYDLITGQYSLDGGILTYKMPSGLPYYLSEIKMVNLYSSTNLAFFLTYLDLNSTYQTVLKMREFGINYILINPKTLTELDAHLNFTISNIISNPELAILQDEIGAYNLYKLGPYKVEKTSIQFLNFVIDYRYTNGAYRFVSNESSIFLEVFPTEQELGHLTIADKKVTNVSLSDYDFLIVRVKGSKNARILVRLFLDEGGFDYAYWKTPMECNTITFDLKNYSNRTVRQIYISIKSCDYEPAYVKIKEITFIKVKDYFSG